MNHEIERLKVEQGAGWSWQCFISKLYRQKQHVKYRFLRCTTVLRREEECKMHRAQLSLHLKAVPGAALTTFQKSLCFDGLSLLRTSRTMLSTSQMWSWTQSRRRSRRGPALHREGVVSSKSVYPQTVNLYASNLTSLTIVGWDSLSRFPSAMFKLERHGVP